MVFVVASQLIIFLTGCAPGGYHRDVASAPPVSVGGSELGLIGAPFGWPLQGEVVVPFGAKEDTISLKGIVIQANQTDAVVAAQDGRVGFIDEKLQGYGKTVILEHAHEFSTVYARNSEILVTLGQNVKRGQTIAKIGPTGKGASSRLYFELRKETEAQDPMVYLQKSA